MCVWYVQLKKTLKSLRDLLLPRRCIVCGEALSCDESHICFECFENLPLTHFWEWPDNPAYERMAEKVDIESACSLYHFRSGSPYRSINYHIKYSNGRTSGYRLGYLLGQYIAASGAALSADAVIPVPLHWSRLWKRGYNQAEVIARGIADALGISISTKILRRNRRTKTQTKLSNEGKRDNVRGAFSINEVEAKKMLDSGVGHILLVDDVLTTGATLGECASLLIPRFRVSVATLAFVS